MGKAVYRAAPQGVGVELQVAHLDAYLAVPGALDELAGKLDSGLVLRVVSKAPVSPAAVDAIARALGDPVPLTGERARTVPGYDIIGDLSTPARFDDGREHMTRAAERLHQDGPAAYSILHSRVVTPAEPMAWADLRAVYAGLDAALKAQILPLRAMRPGGAGRRPLVADHPHTGEPILLPPERVGSLIEGMDEAQSAALINSLWIAVDSSPRRYEAVMASNDLYIWDNIAAVHCNPRLPRDQEIGIWFLTVPGRSKIAAHAPAMAAE